jgi:hypothetical protein
MSRWNALVLVVVPPLVALGGCASSFELKNPIPKQQDKTARLAAYEAAADYPQPVPGRQGTPTVAITAVVDRDGKLVRIVNPTETPYHGVRVWLDQKYVAWLNELPPRRVVHVAQSVFADADRKSPSLASVRVVEIQTNGDLYRALGPAMEPAEADRPKGRGVELSFPPKFGGSPK